MQLRKGKSRLALAAAAVACTIAACSTERAGNGNNDARRSGDGASISLNLQPVSGLTINEIAWVVTRGSELPAVGQGIIPVPGDGRDLSFGVPLPAGTDYFLSLAAVSPDGSFTCTAGAGPFAVEARRSTELAIVLTCIAQIGSQATGPVDVESDACPTLTVHFALAEPAVAAIGESLTLNAEASDSGGRPISYMWSIANPALGTFANPSSQITAFTCNAPSSNAVITLTADNGECDTTLDLGISCVTIECGDGVVQPGETCDINDPATPSCPADCTEICGDGIVEGSEQCEPPNTPVCTATCLQW